ncbi:MAG: hypothetical protein IOC86_12130 [Aestuariivirga sp.]|nr:hypothetical protein [Aestuariivirga sp.]
MAGIILHHYGISLFSERVRLALGFKGVPWRSVDIPAMMPKPDLMPPDDTGRDPVRGRLPAADAQHLTLRYEHPRVGEVNMHFPRAGFDVTPA